MDYSPNKMSDLLKEKNFNFKKKYGQNFIIDKNVIDNIVSKSLVDNDTLVIEVGPGAGSLTSLLCEKAKFVLAYEIDESIKGVLESNIGSNAKVIYGDFLKQNVFDELKNYEYKKLYMISNLPYYITTPIIMKFIDEGIPVDKIVVMVQKEVGDRCRAKPNSKDYNSLSVFLNYYFNVEKIIDVSRNVFIPRPNVDSIVVSFTKKDNLPSLKNEKLFFKLVRDSFIQKRKTLKNNLKGYNLNVINRVLKRHDLDYSVRAEALPISIFVEIANELEVYNE